MYCMHVCLCVLTSRILALKKKMISTRDVRKIKCENMNTHLDLGVKSTLHRYAMIYFCGSLLLSAVLFTYWLLNGRR